MQATDIFLINAVIPLIFIYGRFHDNNEVCEKALTFLEEIGPETNSVTRDWKSAGIDVESAFYTQALLQLTDEYCKKRRCLECRIGCKLISVGKTLISENELMLEP
jgi:transposase